jgi:hypothetical protein
MIFRDVPIIKRKLIIPLLLSLLILSFFVFGVCNASQYWINQTVQVSGGGGYHWSGTLYQGDRLQGSFTVSGGDIKLYIVDADNYAKYDNGQVFIARYSNQAIQVPGVDFTVPYDGTWFVILDNSYSLWNNKAVTVSLTLDSNGFVSTTNDSSMIIGDLAIIGVIAIVVVVVGVIVHANTQSQRRLNSPTYYPTQQN